MKKIFSSKLMKWLLIIIVIGGVSFVGYRIYNRMSVAANAQKTVNETLATVERGDIEVKITGTGTLEPFELYNIVPVVKGNILSAPFEVGMQVQKDDLLYKIDDTDMLFDIEKTKNNIAKLDISSKLTEDSIEDLTIYAPCDGRIENFSLKVGDKVSGNGGKLADIINENRLTASIPFNSLQIKNISVGKKLQLLVSEYMTYVDGIVTYISSSPTSSKGGIALYSVEVEIENPGVIEEGTMVTGIVDINGEETTSPQDGTVSYADKDIVSAQTSGTVKNIYVKNNDWVYAGQKLVEMEDDNLLVTDTKNELDKRELQMTLDLQNDQLEDYNILSPISGTVIEKNFKAGDDIGAASGNTVLMSIADMSKMKFTIDIDELDIAKIVEGQKVKISADALPDTSFEGEVTSIPVLGKSQNGVTTYPVEVTIYEPGKLKPGMNVNAEIIVESKTNILYVPMAAITKMKDRTLVFVKEENAAANENQNQSQNQGSDGNGQKNRTGRFNNSNRQQFAMSSGSGVPREVEVGINNENYIEIISGLKEGEAVILPFVSSSSTNNNTGFPGFGGGGFRNNSGGGENIRMGR